MDKNFCVYILASKKNGTLYVGVTSNLIKRIWEHKESLAEGFTKIQCQCSPHQSNSAFYPLARHLEFTAGINHEDTFLANEIRKLAGKKTLLLVNKYENRIHKKVLREVKNKLETGLKN